MKARLSGTTAKMVLTPAQREACAKVVDDMWRERRCIILRRYLLATALALNDLYHFGDKRLKYTINAIGDIVEDYSNRYTPKEARGEAAAHEEDRMASDMQAELVSRHKIHIQIGDFIQ